MFYLSHQKTVKSAERKNPILGSHTAPKPKNQLIGPKVCGWYELTSAATGNRFANPSPDRNLPTDVRLGFARGARDTFE